MGPSYIYNHDTVVTGARLGHRFFRKKARTRHTHLPTPECWLRRPALRNAFPLPASPFFCFLLVTLTESPSRMNGADIRVSSYTLLPQPRFEGCTFRGFCGHFLLSPLSTRCPHYLSKVRGAQLAQFTSCPLGSASLVRARS